MQALNLPEYTFRTKQENDKTCIFDALRKKWIILTPEEWVRQNFIRFLLQSAYPPGSIGVEVGLRIHGRKLRADGIVYDNFGKVKILLEFKAPQVAIDDKVFAQAADYNTQIGASYIILSNGINHYCARVENAQIKLLEDIPSYPVICKNNT